MKIKKETKIDIIETNIESIKMGDMDGLIIVDEETFNLGLKSLEGQERYEDCCIMRDNKDIFIGNKKVVNITLDDESYINLAMEIMYSCSLK